MGKVSELYQMARLSYDQAHSDVLDKKADSILEAYKKYYKENTGFFSTDPVLEIKQFDEEDNNPYYHGP
tara:strand:+ start:324 stop:530 length:207 start_codon:yes stop_codon:yes gene_type:complete